MLFGFLLYLSLGSPQYRGYLLTQMPGPVSSSSCSKPFYLPCCNMVFKVLSFNAKYRKQKKKYSGFLFKHINRCLPHTVAAFLYTASSRHFVVVALTVLAVFGGALYSATYR